MADPEAAASDAPSGEERDERASIPTELRPSVGAPFRTADLPPLPQRDRRFPASLWVDAPEVARRLGEGLDHPEPPDASFLRRIGRWLLWRAGPAANADARYLAVDAEDVSRCFTFRLHPDGTGEGTGPDGTRHTRFRTWKEALRDA